MKFFHICFLLLIGMMICSFTSCNKRDINHKIKNEVSRMMGKTIDLKFDVTEIKADTIIEFSHFPTNCYRIICFIPKSSCTKCMFKIIPVLDSITVSMKKKEDTKLILITDYENYGEIQHILSDSKITTSVYVDMKSVYQKNNRMTKMLSRNKTILIDKHSKVVVVGEPFYSEKMKELYINAVSEEGDKKYR